VLVAGIVCVKNQDIHRLINHLLSIKWQSVKFDYTIVDYGSTPQYRGALKKLVAYFGLDTMKVIYVDRDTDPWRHGRAFNIGIKANEQADVIFTVGGDLIYPPNFIEAALDLWKPGVLITSTLVRPSREGLLKPSKDCYYGTLAMAAKEKFFEIRGYEEDYTHWGREDTDLVERLKRSGLEARCLDNIPGWHQHHESGKINQEASERNTKIYYERTKQIKRNPDGWGEL
jgi:GT2 family glycosyltransferase